MGNCYTPITLYTVSKMSAQDNLITLPNPRLRQASKKVNVIDDAVREVIEQMKAAALDWEAERPHEVGVALAAIQIDRPLKIVIIRNNFEDKADRSFSVFINPEIVKLEGQPEADFEGCLSVKNVYGKVKRYPRIRVRALDEAGQPIRIKAEGFLARVLQHEIDHIKGALFVDHIERDPQAFFKLTKDGKLEPLDYEQVQKAGIFRD